jgi:hypothetical protein
MSVNRAPRGQRFVVGAVSLALGSMALLQSTRAWSQEKEESRESFRAFAVSMGNVATGANTTLQITVDRWTTDEERNGLIATLVEKGSEELVDALQDQEETGFVRITGQGARLTRFPSVRLRFARNIQTDGGRVIRLATDRPIGIWEASRNPRTTDYTFSMIELRLDEKNEGEGTLAVGVEMTYDKEKNALVLESLSSEPVRLMKVNRTN